MDNFEVMIVTKDVYLYNIEAKDEEEAKIKAVASFQSGDAPDGSAVDVYIDGLLYDEWEVF